MPSSPTSFTSPATRRSAGTLPHTRSRLALQPPLHGRIGRRHFPAALATAEPQPPPHASRYKGDYDHFEGTRAEALRNNERMRESQEKTKAHMQSFIDRFRSSANRAAMVQSRIKAMGEEEATQSPGAASALQPRLDA